MQHAAGARFNRLRNIRAPHGYVVKAMAMRTTLIVCLWSLPNDLLGTRNWVVQRFRSVCAAKLAWHACFQPLRLALGECSVLDGKEAIIAAPFPPVPLAQSRIFT